MTLKLGVYNINQRTYNNYLKKKKEREIRDTDVETACGHNREGEDGTN